MSDVTIGYGAQFWIEDDASPAVLTKLAEVTNVSPPNLQIDDVEATHYESPDRTTEYVPGFTDAGTISVEMNYIAGSATDTLITEARAAGEVRGMKVVIPAKGGNQQFTFPGIVKGYEPSVPIKDRQTATLTIRVAGAVVQAAAA